MLLFHPTHFFPPRHIRLKLNSPPLYEIVLQDVQAAHHLGEDQHFVATSQQFWQQFVNQHQFTSCLDHSLQLEIQRIWTVAPSEALQDLLLCS